MFVEKPTVAVYADESADVSSAKILIVNNQDSKCYDYNCMTIHDNFGMRVK